MAKTTRAAEFKKLALSIQFNSHLVGFVKKNIFDVIETAIKDKNLKVVFADKFIWKVSPAKESEYSRLGITTEMIREYLYREGFAFDQLRGYDDGNSDDTFYKIQW